MQSQAAGRLIVGTLIACVCVTAIFIAAWALYAYGDCSGPSATFGDGSQSNCAHLSSELGTAAYTTAFLAGAFALFGAPAALLVLGAIALVLELKARRKG